MSDKIFTINARKFSGAVYRSWEAECLEDTEDYWQFLGKFSQTINHQHLGIIRRGTISYEYFWKNRWYSVFRFHEPDGELRNFYCNINQPPTIFNNVLNFVDLDIDVLVWKDFSYQVIDLEEYEINSKLFCYSAEIKKGVRKSLSDLLSLIQNKQFPFNFIQVKD